MRKNAVMAIKTLFFSLYLNCKSNEIVAAFNRPCLF